ncbi:cyclin-T2-like protein [Leptotrombidium deliense]|uniref:Cyclin-T2-like protein n=1 Tax=Leptotrombidium deliense TaxID=299467 RepID=A0A443SUR4_9ACAR|nr:cyclin-T2-like protein [Leptotrombidium deliense]
MDAEKELSYRQQATNLIQDMGQRLQVTQLCINTAIVYMHSLQSIASCALFLAAKVEEQPRKLEHVIKVAHMCLHRGATPLDAKSDAYNEQAQELVVNENIMLQTLGFDIAIEHPHTWVVKFCDLVRASKDLAQTSYFMATNSLHLTTMCLQYKPTVVACVCIHLAYKWSSWEIPRSNEGKDWYYYIDKTITLNVIEELTSEFLAILDKCPSRLKQKQSSFSNDSGTISGQSVTTPSPNVVFKVSSSHISYNLTISQEKKKTTPNKVDQQKSKVASSSKAATSESVTHTNAANHSSSQTSPHVKKLKPSITVTKPIPPQALSYSAYKEKKQKEEKEKERNSIPPSQGVTTKEPSAINFIRDVKIKQEKQSSGHQREVVTKTNFSPGMQQPQFSKHVSEKHKQTVEDKTKFRVKQEAMEKMPTGVQPIISDMNVGNNISSNSVSESFNYGSKLNFEHSLTDGEDSTDMKKEIVSDLKMEFSDNESNHSNGSFNFPSLNLLQDSTQSQSTDKLMKNISQQNRSSFMSIFAEENCARDKTLNSNLLFSDNMSKHGNNDYSMNINAILENKPEIPPPMISPLQADPCISVMRESISPRILSPPNNSVLNANLVANFGSPKESVKVKSEPGLKPLATKSVRSKSPLDDSSDTCKSTETSVTENRHLDKQALPNSPIKLTISKKKLTADDTCTDRNNEESSVKLVIPKDRISDGSNTGETPSKKRKSSPREASTSREKMPRLEIDKFSSGTDNNCNFYESGGDNSKVKGKDLLAKKTKASSNISQCTPNSYPYSSQSEILHPGNSLVRREVMSSNQHQRKHKRDM